MRILERELPRSSDFAVELAAEAAAFDLHHAACEVRRWTPTGRAASDLPWLEPFALRRVEVACEGEFAIAVGARPEADGPLVWRIELLPGAGAHRADLDREAFLRLAVEALARADDQERSLGEWTSYLQGYLRRRPSLEAPTRTATSAMQLWLPLLEPPLLEAPGSRRPMARGAAHRPFDPSLPGPPAAATSG